MRSIAKKTCSLSNFPTVRFLASILVFDASSCRASPQLRDLNDAGTLDLVAGRLLLGYARVSTGEQNRTDLAPEKRIPC